MTQEARRRELRGRERQEGDPVPQSDGVDRPNNGIMLPNEDASASAREDLPTHRQGENRDHPEYSRRVREAMDRRQSQLEQEYGSLDDVPDEVLDDAVTGVENDLRSTLTEHGGGRHLDDVDEIDQLYSEE